MKISSREVAGLGILVGLTIIFGILSNYIQIGIVSINLSLIPIAVAAILYGPLAGLIIGFINGIICMLAPSTATFFGLSVIGTILICLFKTGIAGVISALIFKIFKEKKPFVGGILASLVVPIINTGLFIVGSFIFFKSRIADFLSIVILFNFLLEFVLTGILSPSIAKVIVKRRHQN